MTDEDTNGNSREACPVCGAHALHLLYFPTVDLTGSRPFDELLGMGELKPDQPPGIGCEACGTEWPDLESFRQAQKSDEAGA